MLQTPNFWDIGRWSWGFRIEFRIAWQHGGFGFMDVGQTFGLLGKPFGSLA